MSDPLLSFSPCLFEIGPHTHQAGLRLAMQPRMTSNICPFCLPFQSAGVTGVCYHTWCIRCWDATQLRLEFPLPSSLLSLFTSELLCDLDYKGGRWAPEEAKWCYPKPSGHTVALSTRRCLLSSWNCGYSSSVVPVSQAHWHWPARKGFDHLWVAMWNTGPHGKNLLTDIQHDTQGGNWESQ